MKRPGSARLPLENVRVADISVVLAGPNVTTLLADWGAEVIRIEPLQVWQVSTRGRSPRPPQALIDANRNWINAYPDWKGNPRAWNKWPFHQAHARNKKSMTIDTRTEEGQRIAREIVAISDILVENNVPETMEKLHLDYEELRKVKPDLVMLRMPAYGLSGPYRNFRSLGAHLEGTAGHTWIRGYEDTDPTMTEDVYFGDAVASATGAFAAAIALRQARRTGRGQCIDQAQVESLIPFFGEQILDLQMNGRVAGPRGNDHYAMAPHNAYPCLGEDRWVAIAVGTDEDWRRMVKAMRRPEWAEDPRFATREGRFEHRRELDELVSGWTRRYPDQWVMEQMQAHGVAAGVLNNEVDAYSDPHLNARGFFQWFDHRDAGRHRYPGVIWKMARTPNEMRTPPVTLGEHNEYAYRELLGITSEEYARLEREGHIGTEFPPHLK